MKYITQNDLCFRIGDVSTALTPTNNNMTYTLTVTDHNNSASTLNTYTGQVFFYSLDQKIWYDFLVDMAVNDLDLNTYPQTKAIVPIVDVKLSVSSYNITETVARFALTDDMDSTVTDAILSPTTGNTCNVSPDMFGCDLPRVSLNQRYPAIVYTGSYTPDPVSDEIGCYCHLYTLAKNSVYVFPFTNANTDHDSIKVDAPTTFPLYYKLYRECRAPYMLVWYDPQGFFQSQPFYGSEKDSYTHNTITNLSGYERKYETQEKRTWTLKSDWVRNQKTYHSLFTSPVVWLFDTETQKYHRVLVTTSTWSESRSRKAFRFSVDISSNISTIYR